MRAITDDEIHKYIETREPMDKAGSYALQGTGSAFVERIDGCFTNIIGLPIPKVVSLLRRAGVEVLGRTAPLD
jgi:septum formation protein